GNISHLQARVGSEVPRFVAAGANGVIIVTTGLAYSAGLVCKARVTVIVFSAVALVGQPLGPDLREFPRGFFIITAICKIAHAQKATVGHALVAECTRCILVGFRVFTAYGAGAR